MGLTRQEVNLRRLLAKCELMLKDRRTKKKRNDHTQGDDDDLPISKRIGDNRRLDEDEDERQLYIKYVQSAEQMLQDVVNSTDPMCNDNLFEYERRLFDLQRQLGLTDDVDFELKRYRYTKTGSELDNRNKLFGKGDENVMRQRHNASAAGGDNVDELIDYHRDQQERIAENVLSLTMNLKEQSQLANRIIKRDTDVVGRSTQLTERNFDRLKRESDVLGEHTRHSCKCWMWTILFTVMVVFVCMVLFMKIAKKKY